MGLMQNGSDYKILPAHQQNRLNICTVFTNVKDYRHRIPRSRSKNDFWLWQDPPTFKQKIENDI